MKYFITLFALFLISCGENTAQSPLKEITKIEINESNISLYATDYEANLTATVYYSDASTALGTEDMAWSSSDTNIFDTKTGTLLAKKNGGDATLSIDYKNTFFHSQTVHVKELLSINYSDLNLSITDKEQIIYLSGNFENNETNVTMQGNLTWSVDANATISESNNSAITLTVGLDVTSVELTAILFADTEHNITFSHTFH